MESGLQRRPWPESRLSGAHRHIDTKATGLVFSLGKSCSWGAHIFSVVTRAEC